MKIQKIIIYIIFIYVISYSKQISISLKSGQPKPGSIGSNCSTNSNCEIGSCVKKICAAPTGKTGDLVSSFKQCGSLKEISKRCVKTNLQMECYNNENCFSNVCMFFTNKKNECSLGNSKIGDIVDNPQKCSSGTANEKNICVKSNFQGGCKSNLDCLSANCVLGKCSVGFAKIGDTVDIQEKCGSGQINSFKKCIKSGINQICLINDDCISLNCSNNRCLLGTAKVGDTVDIASKCGSGVVDDKKKCIKTLFKNPCLTNQDCFSLNCVNYVCQLGTAKIGELVDHQDKCGSNSTDENSRCKKNNIGSPCNAKEFGSNCFSNLCGHADANGFAVCLKNFIEPGKPAENNQQCLTLNFDNKKKLCLLGEPGNQCDTDLHCKHGGCILNECAKVKGLLEKCGFENGSGIHDGICYFQENYKLTCSFDGICRKQDNLPCDKDEECHSFSCKLPLKPSIYGKDVKLCSQFGFKAKGETCIIDNHCSSIKCINNLCV